MNTDVLSGFHLGIWTWGGGGNSEMTMMRSKLVPSSLVGQPLRKKNLVSRTCTYTFGGPGMQLWTLRACDMQSHNANFTLTRAQFR